MDDDLNTPQALACLFELLDLGFSFVSSDKEDAFNDVQFKLKTFFGIFGLKVASKRIPAEVEKMRKEAEQFSDADTKKKEEIDIINQADTVIYQTEKSIKDFEGKVDAKEISAIKEKTEELKKLMAEKEKDVQKIKAKLDELNQIAQKAATELYQKAGAQPGEQPKEAPKEKKEDVVDAEVVDDKEKKE